MFGILVGHHAIPSNAIFAADVAAPHRPSRMLGVIAWLPFIFLTLKRAV